MTPGPTVRIKHRPNSNPGLKVSEAGGDFLEPALEAASSVHRLQGSAQGRHLWAKGEAAL